MKKTVYIILFVCISVIAITFTGCIEGSYKKTETVLTKLNSEEDVQWNTVIDNKDYATSRSLALSFNRFIQTSDNGFLIAGFFFDNSGRQNLRLIKTDIEGKIVWDERIPDQTGELLTIIQRDDNGYSVLSRHGSVYIFDSSGTLEDVIATTGPIGAGSTNAIATQDGGSLVGQSRYASPFIIEKRDVDGSVVWSSTPGLCSQPYCYNILAMHELENGEYEIVYLSYDRENSSPDQDASLIVMALLDGNGQVIKQDVINSTELPAWAFPQAGSSSELISRLMTEVPAISSLSGHTDNQINLIDCVIKTDDNGYAVLGSRYYL